MSMELFFWTDSMSVGVPDLDGDHRRLIAMLETLRVRLDGDDAAGAIALLPDLIDYAKVHFAREEGYMAAIGYPGLVQHQQRHDLMAHDVVETMMDPDRGADYLVALSLYGFLVGWLKDHILVEDQAYARHAATVPR